MFIKHKRSKHRIYEHSYSSAFLENPVWVLSWICDGGPALRLQILTPVDSYLGQHPCVSLGEERDQYTFVAHLWQKAKAVLELRGFAFPQAPGMAHRDEKSESGGLQYALA